MNNLHQYIKEEQKLYNELRQIWKKLKEKNKNLIIKKKVSNIRK